MKCNVVVIALLIAMFSSVNAYIDFLGMSNAGHREVRDGKVYLKHEVHHTFNESGDERPEGTYFKVKYEAVHSADFVFVHLNDHTHDVSQQVQCAHVDHDHKVHVKNPHATFHKLFDAKQNGGQHVDNGNHILVAHPRHHCGGEAVFRRVVHHEHKTTITGQEHHELHTERLSYEEVFEHLDLDMDTTHLMHDNGEEFDEEEEHETVAHYKQVHADHVAEGEAIEAEEKARVAYWDKQDEENGVAPSGAESEKQMVTSDKHRKFSTQGWCPSWCKRAKRRIKRAAQRLVKKATQVVKKVAAKAKKVVKNVIKLVKNIGTYEKTKSMSTKAIKYNGDVTKRFNKWNIAGKVYVAGSFYFKAGVKFRIYIKTFKLIETYAYYWGNAKAGAKATVVAATNDAKDDTLITQINLSPISFAIGPIPVVILPKVPITAGYELSIDGKLRVGVVLAASGYIKQGFSYTRSRGFRAINVKRFKYTRDLTPRVFRFSIGLEAFLQADLELQINFIGGPKIGLAVYAEALFQNNRKCSLYLQLNAQIAIAAGAKIDIGVGRVSVYKKSWGPKTLVSYKTPVFRYCRPRKSYRRKAHEFLALENAEETLEADMKFDGEGTEPINTEPVEQTVTTDMNGNYTGSVWYGQSNCEGGQRFSFQVMDDEENFSEFIATISSNISKWDPETQTNKYELTNVQVIYGMEKNITAGMYEMLNMMDNATEIYVVSGNETQAPVSIQPTMYLAISNGDTRGLSISSPALCGNVSLEAAVMTDDNSTFVIFASGESVPESEEHDDTILGNLKAKFKAVWAYAPAIAFVCVVCGIIGGVVMYRRHKSANAIHAKDFYQGDGELNNDDVMYADKTACL